MTDEAAETADDVESAAADESSESDEETTPSASEDDGENTVSDDDFVRLAYTARSVESQQLVDTTDEDIAEEEGVDVDGRTFEPRVIPLGAGHLFPSVESALIGMEVGESDTVEVPESEAFGTYDPDNVRTVSTETIPEDDRYPGARVEIDGEHGFIETIIGGRARVDFNHPLAGEPISYEFELIDIVTDRIEKAKGILAGVVDADLDIWIDTIEEEQPIEPETDDEDDDVDDSEPETELVDVEVLYIESVPQLALNQQWLFRKRQIAQEIIDRLDVDRVVVQETIEGSELGMGMPGMGDLEASIDDVDVDADEIVEELEDELEE